MYALVIDDTTLLEIIVAVPNKFKTCFVYEPPRNSNSGYLNGTYTNMYIATL